MNQSAPAIRNSAKALIIEDGAVLLQRCQIAGQLVHLLPGGTQEFGESFADTVLREVWEETGMRVRVDNLVWVREFVSRNHIAAEGDGEHVVECIFRCTPEIGATIGTASLPDAAQLDVRWVALSDLASLTLWPETVRHILLAEPAAAETLCPSYLGDCP